MCESRSPLGEEAAEAHCQHVSCWMGTRLAQVSLDSIPAHPWFWEALMGPGALRGPAAVQRTQRMRGSTLVCKADGGLIVFSPTRSICGSSSPWFMHRAALPKLFGGKPMRGAVAGAGFARGRCNSVLVLGWDSCSSGSCLCWVCGQPGERCPPWGNGSDFPRLGQELPLLDPLFSVFMCFSSFCFLQEEKISFLLRKLVPRAPRQAGG